MFHLEAAELAIPTVSDTILYFPMGLVGLEDLKRFEIITDDESLPFRRLRSLDDTGVEFVVLAPHGLIPDYTVQIPDEDAEVIGITESESTPEILNILTIHSMQPQRVTANLVAPIVVNPKTKVAKQVIPTNYRDYSTHYSLIDEA